MHARRNCNELDLYIPSSTLQLRLDLLSLPPYLDEMGVTATSNIIYYLLTLNVQYPRILDTLHYILTISFERKNILVQHILSILTCFLLNCTSSILETSSYFFPINSHYPCSIPASVLASRRNCFWTIGLAWLGYEGTTYMLCTRGITLVVRIIQ
jgi:hypothetical protein